MAAEALGDGTLAPPGDVPAPASPSDSEVKISHHAQEILKISRDAEFLHSFLRVGDGETDSEAGDFRGSATQKAAGAAGGPQKGVGDDRAEGEGASRVATHADRGHGAHEDPVPHRRQHHKATFKEVVKDLELSYGGLGALAGKNKGRRGRSVRGEEVYTDKDRAAAVQMGHRDIKQSLRMKRHQERVRALQLPEEADATTLLALGQYELRQGNTNIAIAFVNKALQLSPEDKCALVARSRCYLLLGQPRLALQDAETALEPDKNFVRAIFQKAEALYHLGDFEHSLMYYHRGLRLRPELAMFRLGVQKAQEAIENTIGTGIEESCKIMEQVQRARAVRSRAGGHKSLRAPPAARSARGGEPGQPSQPALRAPSPHSPHTLPPSSAGSARSTEPGAVSTLGDKRADSSAGEERSARRLLGELCVDKLYLEQLLKHPDIRCAHRETASRISSHAEDGVEFLRNRQEFWRQQKLSTGPRAVSSSHGNSARSRPSPSATPSTPTAANPRRTLA